MRRATLTKAFGEAKASSLIPAIEEGSPPEKHSDVVYYGVQGYSAGNNVQRMVKLKRTTRAARSPCLSVLVYMAIARARRRRRRMAYVGTRFLL